MHNIQKHVLLEDNLDSLYPLRATRLAYCRNKILSFIFDNQLNNEYTYAIHCDLDDRFWCVDFESICNSFQYSLDDWDAMTCVSKNKKYYDYWALRVDNCWFNKNIFSCTAGWPELNFETKTHEFIKLLNQTPNLLKTNSSFNGLGIYKLSAIKNCKYDATFVCNKCKNTKKGCLEDNDHIGLHRGMSQKKCNIFINTKMQILSKPQNATTYNQYIKEHFFFIKNLKKNPLLYVLKNNLIKNNYLWLDFDIQTGETSNTISNYTDSNIYSFDFNKRKYTLLNNNITVINGHTNNALNTFISDHLNNNKICFMNFNNNDYFDIKKIFAKLITKIDHSCIIIFNNFINYHAYIYKSFKAFYEISQEYNLIFEIIGVNGNFEFIPKKYLNINELTDCMHSETIVAIQIKQNPHKSDGVIQLEKNENKRKNNEKNYAIFDWELYVALNTDFNKNNICNAEKAWNHWSTKGYLENRYIYFDLQKCIQENNLPKNISKLNAIHQFKNDFKKYCTKLMFNREKNNEIIQKYKTELFDWEFYVESNKDLRNIDNYEQAWEHYNQYGEKENRITNDFNWLHYLILNQDLIDNNIVNEETAVQHYLNYGITEKRKYNIK